MATDPPVDQDRPPDQHNTTSNLPKLSSTVILDSQSVHKSTTLGNSGHWSKTPLPGTCTIDPNQLILHRANSSGTQTTSTQQIATISTVPISAKEESKISCEDTGKNGGPATRVPNLKTVILTATQPPKISSNFDRHTQKSKSKEQVLSSLPPIRQSVTQNINSETCTLNTTDNTKTNGIPTIQQLNAKFNHNGQRNALTVRQNAALNSANPKTSFTDIEAAKHNSPPLPAVKPTFASTLRSIHEKKMPRIDISPAKQTTKQGYPAVIFKREDYMVKLAERCKFTLIGKFEKTMPKLEIIRRSFEAQVQLKSTVKITHFNSNHVYIDLDNQLDHDTVWFKHSMWIQGREMTLFTWTPTFKPHEETPIAPIWVVLTELPWHMYYMEAMTEIFKSLGRAISLDVATFQKTRGSVAKVKLEVDLTKPRPRFFWIGYDEDEYGDGYWQEVDYEDVPAYCLHCRHQGHLISACPKKRRDEEMSKREEHIPEPPGSQIHHQPILNHPVQVQQPIKASNALAADAARNIKSTRGKPNALKQQYVPKNCDTSNVMALNPLNINVMNPTASLNLDVEAMKGNGRENEKKGGGPFVFQQPVAEHISTKTGVMEAVADALTQMPNQVNVTDVEQQPVKTDSLNDWHCDNPFDALAEPDNVTIADAIHLTPTSGVIDLASDVGFMTDALESGGKKLQVVKTGHATAFDGGTSHTCTAADATGTGNVTGMGQSDAANNVTQAQTQKSDADIDTVGTDKQGQKAFLSATCPGNVPVFFNDSVQGVGPFVQPVRPAADKTPSKSTKEWILKSFYGSKQGDEKNELLVVIEQHSGVVHQAQSEKKMLSNSDQNAKKIQEYKNDNNSKATVSITSQDNFGNIMPLGGDNDEIESNMALTVYVPPQLSGNTLIPTTTLEAMCKQASKVRKEVGKGFFPVTPKARFDIESQEVPTYFLGDLFEESQKDQNEPSKDGKSKWNLNAPLFIPSALRQQEPQVPIEIVDSQYASDLFPTGPSDEVLLQRLNLHDTRGLLQRQNSPPQDLPQKFSSPHPGIIEDGSEYEEEDEYSTAYNDMAEARYAGLSPRVEQACKPKLIKKKRQPLEPKKKEAATKRKKRVQPNRSSKTRSFHRKCLC